MKRRNIFLILTVFSLFLWGCKYDFVLPEPLPDINQDEPVSFSTQIVPIFAEKCISCHSTQAPVLSANVAFSQVVPQYVNATSPESSKVYINAASGGHYAKVSATQAALILTWIKEGAKNN